MAGLEEENRPWHWKQMIKENKQHWKIIKWQAKITLWRNYNIKYCPHCGSNDKTWGHLLECNNLSQEIL